MRKTAGLFEDIQHEAGKDQHEGAAETASAFWLLPPG